MPIKAVSFPDDLTGNPGVGLLQGHIWSLKLSMTNNGLLSVVLHRIIQGIFKENCIGLMGFLEDSVVDSRQERRGMTWESCAAKN